MKNNTVAELFNLSGKTAIVTGASRGLGKAMALAMAQAGANIVITDVLDTAAAVKEMESSGAKAMGIKVDVTQSGDIAEMIKKTLTKFGSIDILINNAGIYYPTPVKDLKENDWDKIIDINLKGTLNCTQAVGKEMCKKKSGVIINIASIAGIMAFAESAAYNASKAAIIMLTKTLASEWASCGIRVNAICPGIFATDMTKDIISDKGFQQSIKAGVPMGRYATPDELMGAAVYLASNASSYVTGHALVVDGGWIVHL